MPANLLRHWRTEKGWDVFELARQAKVSDRLIRKIEAESQSYILKGDTMEKIADALGLPVFSVFFPNDIRLVNMLVHMKSLNKIIHKYDGAMRPEQLFSMHLKKRKDGP